MIKPTDQSYSTKKSNFMKALNLIELENNHLRINMFFIGGSPSNCLFICFIFKDVIVYSNTLRQNNNDRIKPSVSRRDGDLKRLSHHPTLTAAEYITCPVHNGITIRRTEVSSVFISLYISALMDGST